MVRILPEIGIGFKPYVFSRGDARSRISGAGYEVQDEGILNLEVREGEFWILPAVGQVLILN